jgi:hypothetical protein
VSEDLAEIRVQMGVTGTPILRADGRASVYRKRAGFHSSAIKRDVLADCGQNAAFY